VAAEDIHALSPAICPRETLARISLLYCNSKIKTKNMSKGEQINKLRAIHIKEKHAIIK
jgi:hypothetical protein